MDSGDILLESDQCYIVSEQYGGYIGEDVDDVTILQQVVAEHKRGQDDDVIDVSNAIFDMSSSVQVQEIDGCQTLLTEVSPDEISQYQNLQIITVTDVDVEPWMCPYRPCGQGFDDCDNLTRHILSTHITKVFKCNHCDRLFHREVDRDQHDMSHNTTTDDFDDYFVDNFVIDDDYDLKPDCINIHKCSFCEKTFGRKHHLIRHLKIHTRPFKCAECDSAFGTADALTVHQLTHTDEKPHACKHCAKSYRNPVHLSEHELTHRDSNPFSCPYCTVEYTTRGPLRIHVFYKHFNGVDDCFYYKCPSTGKDKYLTREDAQRHKCTVCNRGFARKCDVKNHDLTWCRENNTLKCTKCSQKYSKEFELQSHEDVCTGDLELGDEESLQNDTNSDVKSSTAFAHRCALCSKRFSQHFQLTRHMLKHTKPYKCDVCGRLFVSPMSLRIHTLIHGDASTATTHQCPQCPRSYRHKQQLRNHTITQHSDANPYSCPYCPKSYSGRNPLRSHVFYKHFITTNHTEDVFYYKDPSTNKDYYLKPSDATKHMCSPCQQSFPSRPVLVSHLKQTHSSNPRPHLCAQCGAGFPNKTRLGLHVKSHGKTRDYQCAICGNRCTTKSSLTSHMVVHSNERPYSCEFCDKTFARRIQLQRHNLTHTGERNHQCDTCGKMFPTSTDVRKHSIVHNTNRDRQHICPHCSKSFVKKRNLTNHMRQHEIITTTTTGITPLTSELVLQAIHVNPTVRTEMVII